EPSSRKPGAVAGSDPLASWLAKPSLRRHLGQTPPVSFGPRGALHSRQFIGSGMVMVFSRSKRKSARRLQGNSQGRDQVPHLRIERIQFDHLRATPALLGRCPLALVAEEVLQRREEEVPKPPLLPRHSGERIRLD